jgi:hypothetical protein
LREECSTLLTLFTRLNYIDNETKYITFKDPDTKVETVMPAIPHLLEICLTAEKQIQIFMKTVPAYFINVKDNLFSLEGS